MAAGGPPSDSGFAPSGAGGDEEDVGAKSAGIKRFTVKVKECKACKHKSTDKNPIASGPFGVMISACIIWLYGTAGCPSGDYCKICYTTFKLTFKKTYSTISALLTAMSNIGVQAEFLSDGWVTGPWLSCLKV